MSASLWSGKSLGIQCLKCPELLQDLEVSKMEDFVPVLEELVDTKEKNKKAREH